MDTVNWRNPLSLGGLMLRLAMKVYTSIGRRRRAELDKILFYGADNEERNKQIGLDNLCCIYYIIMHASFAIDICVPRLASDIMASCLISLREKGLEIRVAIHKRDNFQRLATFCAHGIEVKFIDSERMDHEFVLIDATSQAQETLAVINSIDNYSIARVNCNRDHTLVTSDRAVVTALKAEFNRIWDSAPIAKPREKANNES